MRSVPLQLGERRRIAEIVAFHVADGDGQHFALRTGVGEGRFGVLHAHLHRLANVLQADVAHQRTGQQPDSHKIWKPLQMPSTNPPPSANLRTDSMTGENLAMAPVRR